MFIRLHTRQPEELCFNGRQENSCFYSPKILTDSGFHPAYYSFGRGTSVPEDKTAVREVYDTPTCTDELKTGGAFTLGLQYAFVACTGRLHL
jgi:hypothetical protein